LIDFEGAIDVPGFVNGGDFPHTALILSATSVSLSICTILNILMMYRFIVLFGSGLMDISPRRATMPRSQARAVVSSKSRARMAS
jgi:hypothetical protein